MIFTLLYVFDLGILSFGEVIYTAVILVVTCKLVLVTNTFFALTIALVVLFGIVAWTGWFVFSSYLMASSLQATYGFFQMLVPSAYFWMTVILATVVALYRDIAYKWLVPILSFEIVTICRVTIVTFLK